MNNSCGKSFARAQPLCVISFFCIGCGGGSSSSASQGGSSQAGVDFALSSTFASTDNATFAGGFNGVISAMRASQSSADASTWRLVPSVGTLSAQQGDRINYTPPAASALEVPTNVAVDATIGSY